MDLLRAINHILPALGEHPVSSVDAKHPTVSVIYQNIQDQLSNLLLRGWWFNTVETELLPSPEGEVALPLDTLAVLPKDPRCPGVQRNGRLYNLNDMSFLWPVGQSIPVELYQRLEFEDVPESAARYILNSALVQTYLTDIGLEQVVQSWQQAAFQAMNTLESEHMRFKRYSTKRNSRWIRFNRAVKGF